MNYKQTAYKILIDKVNLLKQIETDLHEIKSYLLISKFINKTPYIKNLTNDKTIIIDCAQYRNIKDYSILKGQIIVMQASIEACYERVLNRWKSTNNNYTEKEFKKYAKKN